MRSLWVALSFLTIAPWINSVRVDEKEMYRSLYFYPLVGMLLGLALLGLRWLGFQWELGIAGSAVVVTCWLIFTGGLHADGLMDSADGLFSGKEKKVKLEIMRDSRVGAMGVIALIVVLGLKVSFLEVLPLEKASTGLFLVPAVARLSLVWAIINHPYARSEPGLGRSFGEKKGIMPFLVGALYLLLIGIGVGEGHYTIWLLAALGGSLLVAGLISARLDGHTGDTYGFLCEVTEVIALMGLVVGVKALGG